MNCKLLSISTLRTFYRLNARRPFSKEIKQEEEIDKPIPFLSSDASKWKAMKSRSGGTETAPWFQPYVISACLSVFLFYFCVLREESDIDQKLGQNLFEQVPGLEEKQLEVRIEYNKENNLDTTDLKARLKEVQTQK